mgnify:CR=1 FL=1
MTKTQLVAALAEQMGSDKKVAGAALDAIAAVVAREVAAGGAVTLPGLGKVVCRARPERQVARPRRRVGRCRRLVDHRPGAPERPGDLEVPAVARLGNPRAARIRGA